MTVTTKVSQVVPVKISLDSEPSKNVVPGMNAEVKIHKIKGHFMTTTFIIVYIVIALILIGLINVLFQNQEKS